MFQHLFFELIHREFNLIVGLTIDSVVPQKYGEDVELIVKWTSGSAIEYVCHLAADDTGTACGTFTITEVQTNSPSPRYKLTHSNVQSEI